MPKSVGGEGVCLLGDSVKLEPKSRTTSLAEMRFQSGSDASRPAGPLYTLYPVVRMLLRVFVGTQPGDALCSCSRRLGLVAV